MLFNRFALTALRELAGVKKSALAKRAGHSAPYMTQVENGDRVPSVSTIEKYAEILGTDPRAFCPEPSFDELVRALVDERRLVDERAAS